MNAALTTFPAWQALVAHHDMMRDVHLRQLFADDPTRGERLSFDAEGILVDSSNNRITDETLSLLLQLAVECGLRQRIEAMFRGEKINVTENRSVLHCRCARRVRRRLRLAGTCLAARWTQSSYNLQSRNQLCN